MINIVMAEEQAIPRRLYELYINQSEDCNLIYSLDSVDAAPLYSNMGNIDLMLIDVGVTNGGFEAVEEIREKRPKIRIVVMTSVPEFSYLEKAKKSGADSFWYQSADSEELLDIIRRTYRGESIFPERSPEIRIGLASSYEMSDRELEVLRELTSGAGDSQIAEDLHLSVWTVRTHIKHMMEKTGFTSRTALAVAARTSGLVVYGSENDGKNQDEQNIEK